MSGSTFTHNYRVLAPWAAFRLRANVGDVVPGNRFLLAGLTSIPALISQGVIVPVGYAAQAIKPVEMRPVAVVEPKAEQAPKYTEPVRVNRQKENRK